MNLTHIERFVAAMQRKDIDAMLQNMADDVTLKTPLVREPFVGKAAVRPVVAALFQIVSKFELREVLEGPTHVAQFFGVTIGTEELDGIDYFLTNSAGLIQEMTVLWRPLPSILAAQEQLDRIGS